MTQAQQKERLGYEQARAQMDSISEMVRALGVDYDRLAWLNEERAVLVDNKEEAETYPDADENSKAGAIAALAEWDEEYGEELRELSEAAGDCESYDEALERIHNDPLSVEVRSGWTNAGEDMQPEEFRIVLCTGGPHVEIRGDLDDNNQPSNNQPSRAYLHYKDWGESGDYFGDNLDTDALLTYAQQFYF